MHTGHLQPFNLFKFSRFSWLHLNKQYNYNITDHNYQIECRCNINSPHTQTISSGYIYVFILKPCLWMKRPPSRQAFSTFSHVSHTHIANAVSHRCYCSYFINHVDWFFFVGAWHICNIYVALCSPALILKKKLYALAWHIWTSKWVMCCMCTTLRATKNALQVISGQRMNLKWGRKACMNVASSTVHISSESFVGCLAQRTSSLFETECIGLMSVRYHPPSPFLSSCFPLLFLLTVLIH